MTKKEQTEQENLTPQELKAQADAILAADQASVDLIYALKPEDGHDLVERMETRHGLRQLSYMKELGMGNDRYTLIDIDHDDAPILPAQAVKDVKPFAPDGQE